MPELLAWCYSNLPCGDPWLYIHDKLFPIAILINIKPIDLLQNHFLRPDAKPYGPAQAISRDCRCEEISVQSMLAEEKAAQNKAASMA